MVDLEKITQSQVWEWVQLGDEDFDLEGLRQRYHISAESTTFYTAINRLLKERKVKRLGRGRYRRVIPIEPVKWWDDKINEEPLVFKFPRCYEDGTEFGIEDFVEVFPGGMILVTGRSNFGKTVIALSIMGENLDLMRATLMGSEYTASDGKISPMFKRRMKRMNWVEWMKDGEPRFQLLPVGGDYEDYIEPDQLNIIDWISLNGEYYLIDRVMKSIKDRVGNGVAVVVLQKNKDAEFGEGGERTVRYADVELRIDAFGENESLLTIGKVKAPKGKATGRTFAFTIVDYGANLHNIREVVKCRNCWGKGYVRSGNENKRCQECHGKKFIDK